MLNFYSLVIIFSRTGSFISFILSGNFIFTGLGSFWLELSISRWFYFRSKTVSFRDVCYVSRPNPKTIPFARRRRRQEREGSAKLLRFTLLCKKISVQKMIAYIQHKYNRCPSKKCFLLVCFETKFHPHIFGIRFLKEHQSFIRNLKLFFENNKMFIENE